MKDTVLVMGGAGFLGRSLIRELSPRYEIVSVVRGANSVNVTNTSRVRQLVQDLEHVDQVESIVRRFAPTAVINCAATVRLGNSVELSDIFVVNSLLPAVLANSCRELGAHLVHMSTVSVHGSRCEYSGGSAAINPDSPYGVSKLLADEMILASGASTTILRLPGIYGINGPDHLGINRAISSGILGEPIVLQGSGRGKRNYLSTIQVAEICKYVLQDKLQGVLYVSGHSYEIREYLQMISDTFRVRFTHLEEEEGGTEDSLVECDQRISWLEPFPQALIAEFERGCC